MTHRPRTHLQRWGLLAAALAMLQVALPAALLSAPTPAHSQANPLRTLRSVLLRRGKGTQAKQVIQPSGYLLGGQALAGSPVLAPAPLPIFSAALAASRAGTSRTLIAMVGDSTTAGVGAGGSGDYGNNAHASAVPEKLTSNFIASGLPAVGHAAFGFTSSALTQSTYNAYNTQALMGAGWAPNANSSAGGPMAYLVGNGSSYVMTDPTGIYNTLDVVFPVTATATTQVNVNFTAGQVGSFSENSATSGIARASFTGTPGTSGIGIKNNYTSPSIYVIGAIASVAANKGVLCMNMGWSGSSTVDWTNTTFAFGPLAAIAAAGTLDAKLVTIQLGINDWQNGVSLSTYQANLTTLIATAKTAGMDVALVAPNRTDTALTPQTTQDSYIAAMAATALAQGVRFIDPALYDARLATYATANGAGLMYDQRHPNAAGYAIVANAIYASIIT